MGLKLTLKKQDNKMYYDFIDAYWKVENVLFSNSGGISYLGFTLNAYPSRDASKMYLKPINYSGEIPVGGAESLAYEPRIWYWEATFKTADVFPSGIPITETEQKDEIYKLVKKYTGLPFEDVLEN